MALNKQALPINFIKGLDTKTDPFQVSPGNFLALQNSIFTKAGLLQKRNGFGLLSALPDNTSTFLTTFNGNLTAIGTSLNAYSQPSEMWIDKGNIQPLEFSTLPVIRNNLNQTYADSALSSTGLLCTVYAEQDASTTTYKYVIADSTTGQNISAPRAINASGTVLYTPKVFLLNRYFIILFNDFVGGVNHISYQAVPITSPTTVNTAVSVSAQSTPHSQGSFDGLVINNSMYIAWNANTGGGAIKVTFIDQALTQHQTVTFAGYSATNVSLEGDSSTIFCTTLDVGTNVIHAFTVTPTLLTVLTPTVVPMGSDNPLNVTSTVASGLCTVIAELSNAYTYDGSIKTNYVASNTITQAGVLGTYAVSVRSLGLASEAFILNDTIYYLGIYGGPSGQTSYQPTYFLMNLGGQVISRFAYENGGPYYVTGLSSVIVNDNIIKIPYLFKDLIQSVNKNTNVPAGSQTAGIYSQTGINIATMVFGTDNLVSAEIGNNLNLSGGFLTMYDGYLPVENNFFVYPDNVEATTATGSGSLSAQQYFYQATYEWTDNQGNAFKSAPSIPITITTTTASSTNTIHVPTLRLTYKISNPVKIVLYRWSTAQQVYYQVTSITSPTLNDTTIDSVTITDAMSDAQILGNNVLYTTGGVVENISPPPSNVLALFQSRLFLVDAEDPNLLWFSKQIIEATPVEMSDLFTIYVAPTTSAQGSTGPVTAMSALDDKLILFKQDAMYYTNGVGPDNTGANNQFSEPIFISSTIGCTNPNSIVFMPQGLMFQSDKGIWLLGRDLSTTYIGSPVEAFNSFSVLSAINVSGTNQVRFTLSNGVTLMYDYFYGQWGTFVNVPSVSSTLYQNLHTYIDQYGQVFQETEGQYLDGAKPVLLSFTTGWMNLAGLQGFERAYFFYILGTYKSPHKLQVQIAYDYALSPSQTAFITPGNYSTAYGLDPSWGSTPTWGGKSTLEQWRIFFKQQKCQSFQITISEVFDASLGTVAGAGLTLSGVNMIVGLKKGYTTIRAARSVS